VSVEPQRKKATTKKRTNTRRNPQPKVIVKGPRSAPWDTYYETGDGGDLTLHRTHFNTKKEAVAHAKKMSRKTGAFVIVRRLGIEEAAYLRGERRNPKRGTFKAQEYKHYKLGGRAPAKYLVEGRNSLDSLSDTAKKKYVTKKEAEKAVGYSLTSSYAWLNNEGRKKARAEQRKAPPKTSAKKVTKKKATKKKDAQQSLRFNPSHSSSSLHPTREQNEQFIKDLTPTIARLSQAGFKFNELYTGFSMTRNGVVLEISPLYTRLIIDDRVIDYPDAHPLHQIVRYAIERAKRRTTRKNSYHVSPNEDPHHFDKPLLKKLRSMKSNPASKSILKRIALANKWIAFAMKHDIRGLETSSTFTDVITYTHPIKVSAGKNRATVKYTENYAPGKKRSETFNLNDTDTYSDTGVSALRYAINTYIIKPIKRGAKDEGRALPASLR